MAMTMTDPIADMLARLRNANSAYHDAVTMPHSKIKVGIAEILKQEGYIAGWHVEDAAVGQSLVLELKYGPSRERSIAGLRRVSKPGLRVYATRCCSGSRCVPGPAPGWPGGSTSVRWPRSARASAAAGWSCARRGHRSST